MNIELQKIKCNSTRNLLNILNRLTVSIIIISMSIFLFVPNVYAFTKYKQSEHLEKNQWGALEDILNDWKLGMITTDECALYGCYILAAQDSTRADKNIKINQIPSKYKLNKKSSEAGPYFFVYYLYKNEDKLGPKALEAFRSSDWCDEDFINEIIKNDKIDEALKILFSLHKDEIAYKIGTERDLLEVLCYLSEIKIISYEATLITTYLYVDDRIKYNRKFATFKKKYNLDDYPGHFNLIINLSEKVKKTTNRKASNVLNFHNKYFDLRRTIECDNGH